MSTSAGIHIVRNGNHVSLSQRSDGYPTWVLKQLAACIKYDNYLSLEDTAVHLGNLHYMSYDKETRDVCMRGNTLQLVRFYDPNKSVDSHQWNYILDFDQREVQVFRNEFPRDEGMVDPMAFLESIMDECKEEERNAIQESVDVILAAGFVINKS